MEGGDEKYERALSFDEVKRAFEISVNENYEDVKPVATRIMFMNDLLSLRPESYSHLPSDDRFSIIEGFPNDGDALRIHNPDTVPGPTFTGVYNPQMHRLRRVILLRHVRLHPVDFIKKVSANFKPPLPPLEARIRRLYREIDLNSLKLINYYPRKLIQSWLQSISQKLATPHTVVSESKKKGRRSREEQEKLDNTRFQLISVRAKERIIGIDSIKKKHELVKKILAEQKKIIKDELQYEAEHPIAISSLGCLARHEDYKGETLCCTLNDTDTRTYAKSTSPDMFTHLKKQKNILIKTNDALKNSNSAQMEQYLIGTIGEYNEFPMDPNENSRTFKESIFGDIHNKRNTKSTVSLWSGRTLKPIIMLDYEIQPPKLKLLIEIQSQKHTPPPRSPIKYKHLKSYQLPQIHKLLRDNFWPGINLNEFLLHPEHTVVVMYKELVVGCGFITTFGYIPYLCVHPEWRGAGIGKFILYHLIQNNPQNDITLHIPANNPAVTLYQKFCFKIEESVHNFYEKFTPTHNEWKRSHALFMKLRN